MAETTVITCPECTKKFKGKSDLQGKKIKCPFCQKPFVVSKPPAPVTASAGGADDDDEGSDPYKAHELDLAPRCPNCAKELLSERDVVCLHCGYNTQTRSYGATVRVFSHTFGEVFMHLLPGLLAAFGILLEILGVTYFCVVFPDQVRGTYLALLDSEGPRLWIVIILLGTAWTLGFFAYHRLALNPNPPDKVKD